MVRHWSVAVLFVARIRLEGASAAARAVAFAAPLFVENSVASRPHELLSTSRMSRTAAAKGPLPRHHMMPTSMENEWRTILPSFSVSVETFDGSDVVDPVVVSSVFWSSLKAKLLSVIVGQVLAGIAFVALSSVFVTQILPKFGNSMNDLKPSSLAQAAVERGASVTKTPDFGKLVVCIAIDVLGTSSELVPLLGELSDVAYAPLAAALLRSLYGGSNVIFALEFVEEILPFTDILPLATLCWVVDSFFADSDIARLLQLGQYSTNNGGQNTVVDVNSIDLTDKNGGENKRR